MHPFTCPAIVLLFPCLLLGQTASPSVRQTSGPSSPATEDSLPMASIVIDATKRGIRVSPSLYGLFFEEINLAGDGGLYAELVRNRSFEDASVPDHWSLAGAGAASGRMGIDSASRLNEANRHSLRLTVSAPLEGDCGIVNSGYWGIPVVAGHRYVLSFYARTADSTIGPVKASITSARGKEISSPHTVPSLTHLWKRYVLTLTADSTDHDGRLRLAVTRPGTVWFDLVSLFPERTWNQRTNGLRPDLVGMLAGLQPSFVRFPGGCWVEGNFLTDAYRWKNTVGDIAERRTVWNLWNYFSTNGLGYHEYLQFCEDLGAEPLFVINCGMAHHETAPIGHMHEWIQDALDAVDYANGPVTSHWGALRANSGHPEPFNLRFMEIGNENGGKEYEERYALLYDALKARYPGIHLIADVWGKAPGSRPVEILDEHYYSSPEFFYDQADRYDHYDRKGPRIYVGEYAVTSNNGTGALRGALAEAAFMIGMERNSDVVIMASYAPLFANIEHRGWTPDLINFDGHRVYGTPSYYVQGLFARNRPDAIAPVELLLPPSKPPARSGAVGVGTWNTQAEFKEIRVCRDSATLLSLDFRDDMVAKNANVHGGTWRTFGGALNQTVEVPDCRLVFGDTSWRDYTINLKARKIAGAEGFLVLFHVKDDQNYSWWNIGGWGNTRHAIEVARNGGKSLLGTEVAGTIETGRWYDVVIEVRDQHVRCYLDGRLVHDAVYSNPPPLFVTAGAKEESGELILKVVNRTENTIASMVRLRGMVGGCGGTQTVLSSGNMEDENSLSKPSKVVPVTTPFAAASPSFRLDIPARSLTVMRIKPER